MCEGKQSDKIDIFFEMIRDREQPKDGVTDAQQDEIGLDCPNIDLVLILLMEFSLIQSELFRFGIHYKSKQYRDAIKDQKKRRSIRAMISSDFDTINEIGFLKALFQSDISIGIYEFRERMKLPQCSWILDDNTIRSRYRQTFMDESLLDQIEKNGSFDGHFYHNHKNCDHYHNAHLSKDEWKLLQMIKR